MKKNTPIARRAFLAGAGAAAVASANTPVRAERLDTAYPGVQFYDQQERNELTEAYDAHSPFRYYGPGKPPQKAARFEQELSAFTGAKYALGVTSGTAALHVALTALGVGPGDEVILPAWTWHSCYTTILMTGALPVFAEVDESFTLDPADVEKKITPQTKAIMAVHLFGTATDMDPILALARRHGIRTIEDAAQSFGGQYKGKRLGAIADIGIYSFQLHKMITAGEGGAVVTNHAGLYERSVRFHDLGLMRAYHKAILGEPQLPYFIGVNYRMNEMTAAIMRAQLRKADMIVGRHRRNARYLRERLGSLPGLRFRRGNDPEGETGWTLDFLLADKPTRDRFLKAVNAENIAMSAPSAATPLPAFPYIENKMAPHPLWPSFTTPRGREMRYGPQCCPKTQAIYDRAATLTVGPKYTNRDLDDIVAAITKVHRALA
jgi:8-amino-3,8-dideoxy-alpha-D-manno-octulosonate transaminase